MSILHWFSLECWGTNVVLGVIKAPKRHLGHISFSYSKTPIFQDSGHGAQTVGGAVSQGPLVGHEAQM